MSGASEQRRAAAGGEPRTSDGEPFEAAGAEESAAAAAARVAPGLARIAATAWWRTTGWAVGASARATGRVARAALSGESPAELFDRTGVELREYAQRLLGMIEGDGEGEGPGKADRAGRAGRGGAQGGLPGLRSLGSDLLRQSADVDFDEETHPAYARILTELAPDEARILRLLAVEGAQPSVDVRTGVPLVSGSTQLVASGLSMIGAGAGLLHTGRVPAYLNNLHRLGLIWFSREPVRDPTRYQVLEAQPEVTTALDEAGRLGRTVRRSVQLTPFGTDFCEVCLPLGGIERDAVGAPGVEAQETSGAPGAEPHRAAGDLDEGAGGSDEETGRGKAAGPIEPESGAPSATDSAP